jgi:hypothetical protein
VWGAAEKINYYLISTFSRLNYKLDSTGKAGKKRAKNSIRFAQQNAHWEHHSKLLFT